MCHRHGNAFGDNICQLTAHAHVIRGHIHSKHVNYCCGIQAHLAFIRLCRVFPGAIHLSVFQRMEVSTWAHPTTARWKQRRWLVASCWRHLPPRYKGLFHNSPLAQSWLSRWRVNPPVATSWWFLSIVLGNKYHEIIQLQEMGNRLFADDCMLFISTRFWLKLQFCEASVVSFYKSTT